MGTIEHKDIRGYDVGEELVCPACMKDIELTEITEASTLCEDDLDNDTDYYCDRCKKRI